MEKVMKKKIFITIGLIILIAIGITCLFLSIAKLDYSLTVYDYYKEWGEEYPYFQNLINDVACDCFMIFVSLIFILENVYLLIVISIKNRLFYLYEEYKQTRDKQKYEKAKQIIEEFDKKKRDD